MNYPRKIRIRKHNISLFIHLWRQELTVNISENNTIDTVTSFRMRRDIGISCKEVFHFRIVKHFSSLPGFSEKRCSTKANLIYAVYNAASSSTTRIESLQEMTEWRRHKSSCPFSLYEHCLYGILFKRTAWRIVYLPPGPTPEIFQTKRMPRYHLSWEKLRRKQEKYKDKTHKNGGQGYTKIQDWEYI